MDNWTKDLLNEVRGDVKHIRQQLPQLATKEEVSRLEKRVDSHGFIFKAVAYVGGSLWAIIKFIIPNIGH